MYCAYRFSVALFCGTALLHCGSQLSAHPGHDLPIATTQASAPTGLHVEMKEENGFRLIRSDGIPDHQTGQFPNRGNPNKITPQSYSFRVPLNPSINEQPTSPMPPVIFGVAKNGVIFDPGTAEFWKNDRRSGWNYDALSGKINLGLDLNNAHVQPNGAYHYHGIPTGLVDPNLVPTTMIFIGYAADGFPIYSQTGHTIADDAQSPLKKLSSSWKLRTGDRPTGTLGPGGTFDGTFVQDFEYVAGSGDLDECNGRQGVTPEYPRGTYYYVLTDHYPFVPRYFRGTPDASFQKGPPGGPGGRPGRLPPPGPAR